MFSIIVAIYLKLAIFVPFLCHFVDALPFLTEMSKSTVRKGIPGVIVAIFCLFWETRTFLLHNSIGKKHKNKETIRKKSYSLYRFIYINKSKRKNNEPITYITTTTKSNTKLYPDFQRKKFQNKNKGQ